MNPENLNNYFDIADYVSEEVLKTIDEVDLSQLESLTSRLDYISNLNNKLYEILIKFEPVQDTLSSKQKACVNEYYHSYMFSIQFQIIMAEKIEQFNQQINEDEEDEDEWVNMDEGYESSEED